MLTLLKLNNFLLVENAEINFTSGISVLTGETGAGKSILINALSLVLGSRGSSSWVGNHRDSTEIIAVFDNPSAKTISALQVMEIAVDDDIILRRILAKNGKTKAFINDTPVTVKSLKIIGEQLVDIYGQHSHYALLKPEVQRSKLDGYGHYANELLQIKTVFTNWKTLTQTYNELVANHQNHHDRMVLLEYQLQELTELDLVANEFTELEIQHSQLSKAAELTTALNLTIEQLHTQDLSAISTIEINQQQIASYVDNYPQLANANDLLTETSVLLQEVVSEVNHILTSVTVDAEQLAFIETRISTLFELSRKHNCVPNDLLTIQNKLQFELDNIKAADGDFAKLQVDIETVFSELSQLANVVSHKRQLVAQELSLKVTEQLQTLGMEGAQFKVELNLFADDKITQYGKEQINFTIETNPGFGFSALSNSASGGELSRIGLAVQVCSNHNPDIDTLIMDEIDSGIGGKTAAMVGAMLQQLAQKSQIICVTHLPQIASIGQQNIKIDKQVINNNINHSITTLTHSQRIVEIARMLAGAEITEQTLKHAAELLANS